MAVRGGRPQPSSPRGPWEQSTSARTAVKCPQLALGTWGFLDADFEVTFVTLLKDTEGEKDKIKNCSGE